MFYSIAAISVGASCGALLRWFFGLQFNTLFTTIPMGTVAANLLGGYLIGLAIGFFNSHPLLSPEYRLLVITGFLGGLTTFSTFSAEVANLLQAGRFSWALATVSLHVIGSVALTLLGVMTINLLRA
ncbi:CrcB protein [Oxalobacteraceae bacterium GrIS 2.11]